MTAFKTLDWDTFIDIKANGDSTLDYCILTVANFSYAIRAPLDPAVLLNPGDLYPYDRYTLEIDFSYKVIAMDSLSHTIKEKAIIVNK
jgi:hypothetical protein